MKEMIELMNKMTQDAFENSRRLAEINQSAMEKLMAQQVALMDAWVETGVKNLELVGKAKGYQDVVSGQAELAREYSQKLMASGKSCAEVLTEAREAAVKLVDTAIKSAGEDVKQATASATKRAA
ncbi:phasin family protein [Thioalkalivibrio sulfidiphilus]|uniref:phasin family protein n=1 Tax=Thioalkalivibrio sulfidiphilus TaxID=1033854 RepID=UPI0003A94105|nr:phasin family protein [Thioalkalivibrio sulfidiphilus]